MICEARTWAVLSARVKGTSRAAENSRESPVLCHLTWNDHRTNRLARVGAHLSVPLSLGLDFNDSCDETRARESAYAQDNINQTNETLIASGRQGEQV